jgi:hypothetical protein
LRAKQNNPRKKPLTARDILKLEIAGELGLLDKIERLGWSSLSAIEAGRIGGFLAARLKKEGGQ